jgi:hypothetical protein
LHSFVPLYFKRRGCSTREPLEELLSIWLVLTEANRDPFTLKDKFPLRLIESTFDRAMQLFDTRGRGPEWRRTVETKIFYELWVYMSTVKERNAHRGHFQAIIEMTERGEQVRAKCVRQIEEIDRLLAQGGAETMEIVVGDVQSAPEDESQEAIDEVTAHDPMLLYEKGKAMIKLKKCKSKTSLICARETHWDNWSLL